MRRRRRRRPPHDEEYDVFTIGPGHDSVVIGDGPYVSLHFVGASSCADREPAG